MKVNARYHQTINVEIDAPEIEKIGQEYIVQEASINTIVRLLKTKYIESLKDYAITDYDCQFKRFGHYLDHYHGREMWQTVRAATPDEVALFDSLDDIAQHFLKLKIQEVV